MAGTLTLKVISPERLVFQGEVRSLVFPGADGFFGVLARHAPMISLLGTEMIRYQELDGTENRMAITGGFAEVRDNRVTLLVDAGELAGDIDRHRAMAARDRARERLTHRTDPDVDVDRAEAALQRALARLHALGG